MEYLDHNATTPLAPEAREAMLRWLGGPESDTFGNPHSPHRMGRMAAAAVEAARDQVAALMPVGGRVVFTSGATEALAASLIALIEPGDEVVSALLVNNDCTLLVAGENGLGKRTPFSEYRLQSRGGKGIITMNTGEKTGGVVGALAVRESDELMLITEASDGGRI